MPYDENGKRLPGEWPPSPYLVPKEVAERLGVSTRAANLVIASTRHVRVTPTLLRIEAVDLEDWMALANGVVYFVRARGLVKIGFTVDLATRLKTLRSMSPAPVSLLGTIKGSLRLERFLHEHFRKHHAHHEWFRAHESIVGLFPKATGEAA